MTVWGGSPEVLDALLARGADANARNGEDWTPLMLAVLHGNTRAARALVEHGADVNARRSWPGGQTPLGLALFKKDEEAIALLRGSGARE